MSFAYKEDKIGLFQIKQKYTYQEREGRIMFCKRCGSEMLDSAKFCPKCGEVMKPITGETYGDKKQAVTEPRKTNSEVSRKNPHNNHKTLLIITAAVIVVAVLLVLNVSRINNFIHKTFSSPEKYYQFVEKETINDLAVLGGNIYDTLVLDTLNIYNQSGKGELTIELSEDGNELLSMAKLAGVDLTWLQSISVGTDVSIKDEALYLGLNTALNGNHIVSGSLTMDIQEGDAYIQIPDLTNTYLGIDLEDVLDSYDRDAFETLQEQQAVCEELVRALPSQARAEDIIKKYLLIALECIDDVDINTRTLKAEGVQQECTELKITIDSDTILDIAKAVYREMKNDEDIEKYIIDVIEASDIPHVDADDVYDAFIEEIEYEYNSLVRQINDIERYNDSDIKIVMKVYVDNKGNIVGRIVEWDIPQEYNYYSYSRNYSGSISMLMPVKGNEFGYKLSIEPYGNGETIMITGSGKKSGNAISGDFSLKYCGNSLVDIGVTKLNIADLKRGQLNGTFVVEASSGIIREIGESRYLSEMERTICKILEDLQITLTANTKDNSGKYSLGVVFDEEDIGTISVSIQRGNGSKVTIPNARNVIEVGDMDDLEDWIETIEWDKLISNLEKADLPTDIIDLVEDIGDAVEDGDWYSVGRCIESMVYEIYGYY